MQEKEVLIGIYSESGEMVGSKSRGKIDKKNDILKTVNVILTNSQNEVFMILAKDSVWPGKWGGSCAGLVREGETCEGAASRTVNRELGIKSHLQKLGEEYKDFNGIWRIFSVFHLSVDDTLHLNPEDILEGRWVSFNDAQKMIDNGECMPTFALAFSKI